MTQAEMAEAIGVTKASISAWERDKSRPGLETLYRLRRDYQEGDWRRDMALEIMDNSPYFDIGYQD
jgi:transcriptional regulator with XRE-family HTH domain